MSLPPLPPPLPPFMKKSIIMSMPLPPLPSLPPLPLKPKGSPLLPVSPIMPNIDDMLFHQSSSHQEVSFHQSSPFPPALPPPPSLPPPSLHPPTSAGLPPAGLLPSLPAPPIITSQICPMLVVCFDHFLASCSEAGNVSIKRFPNFARSFARATSRTFASLSKSTQASPDG